MATSAHLSTEAVKRHDVATAYTAPQSLKGLCDPENSMSSASLASLALTNSTLGSHASPMAHAGSTSHTLLFSNRLVSQSSAASISSIRFAPAQTTSSENSNNNLLAFRMPMDPSSFGHDDAMPDYYHQDCFTTEDSFSNLWTCQCVVDDVSLLPPARALNGNVKNLL